MNDTQSPPTKRQLMHTRNIKLQGFRRSDGLWDIEAQLMDVRAYDSTAVEKGTNKAGGKIHDLFVCVTADDKLIVQDVTSSMNTHPFHNCPGAQSSLTQLIGASLGSGWRRTLDTKLGQEKGCAHIREMLLQVATTAYQTIPAWYAQGNGDVVPVINGNPPQHLGQCHAWSFSGPIVARLYPQFSVTPKSISD